jgi:hypothetical protein
MGRHSLPTTAREIPLTLSQFNQAGVPANPEGRRVLKVTVLLEVEVGGPDGLSEAELAEAAAHAGPAAEEGIGENVHIYLGNVHGTASTAEWVEGDFYSASRAEGFPV